MSIQSDDTFVYVTQPDPSGYNAGDVRQVLRKDKVTAVGEMVRNFSEEQGAEFGVQILMESRFTVDIFGSTFEEVCEACGIPTEPAPATG